MDELLKQINKSWEEWSLLMIESAFVNEICKDLEKIGSEHSIRGCDLHQFAEAGISIGDMITRRMNTLKPNKMKTKKYYEVTMVIDDCKPTSAATFTSLSDKLDEFTITGFANLGEIWQMKVPKSGKTKLTRLSEDKAEKVKQEFKKPIFTTEDGVYIFKGDSVHWVLLGETPKYLYLLGFNECHVKIMDGFKVFSTKQAAEAYIAKQKKVAYEDVARELFKESGFYIDNYGNSHFTEFKDKQNPCLHRTDPNNATTSHQLEKLLALNKMMNVAVYLNPKGEKADWSIVLYPDGNIEIAANVASLGQPYFISKEAAQQAIEILGEDVVKLALS